MTKGVSKKKAKSGVYPLPAELKVSKDSSENSMRRAWTKGFDAIGADMVGVRGSLEPWVIITAVGLQQNRRIFSFQKTTPDGT